MQRSAVLSCALEPWDDAELSKHSAIILEEGSSHVGYRVPAHPQGSFMTSVAPLSREKLCAEAVCSLAKCHLLLLLSCGLRTAQGLSARERLTSKYLHRTGASPW